MKRLLSALIFAFGLAAFNAHAFQFYTTNPVNGAAAWSDTGVAISLKGHALTDVPTYSYQANDITPAATATDVLCLRGSATKTIRLERIQITADATGAAIIDFYIYKRTTANTGGTFTNPTATLMDSQNAAATAVLTLYSANPSALGTGTLLAGDHYEIPATTGVAYFSPPWVEDFGIRNSQPLVLHGTAEQACISLNGATLPSGLSMYMRFEWTEE